MSDLTLGFGEDPEDPEGRLDQAEGARPATGRPRRRRRRRRNPLGCLVVLVVLVLVVGGLWIGGTKVVHEVRSHFGPAPDYAGPGTGSVLVQVHEGDSAGEIGRTLKAAGVTKSVDAFTAAARKDSKSQGIEVGYYRLKHHMKASAALAVLIDPKNLIQSVVTVPEGARVRDIVTAITKHTKISRAAVVAALEKPAALGLPAAANGNPEGYLFPATYTVVPGETATQLLRQMVTKARQELTALDVAAGAQRLGLTEEQLVTVASILEYEAKRDQDYPKVAEAIYNRLHKGMRLQSDATVSYANGISGQIWTSAAQRANSSPYNTYQHTGLPPGPIGSPGVTTLKAAMDPTKGPWLYWVVVNLRTGETVFSTTLAEHNKAVAQFKKYCQTSTAC